MFWAFYPITQSQCHLLFPVKTRHARSLAYRCYNGELDSICGQLITGCHWPVSSVLTQAAAAAALCSLRGKSLKCDWHKSQLENSSCYMIVIYKLWRWMETLKPLCRVSCRRHTLNLIIFNIVHFQLTQRTTGIFIFLWTMQQWNTARLQCTQPHRILRRPACTHQCQCMYFLNSTGQLHWSETRWNPETVLNAAMGNYTQLPVRQETFSWTSWA